MSKIIKKIVIVVMALVLVLPAFPAIDVEATSAKPKFPTKMTVIYYPKNKSRNYVLRTIGTNSSVISNVKSSNKKVLRGKGGNMLGLDLRKAGKATVTFDALVSGKTYKYKSVVNVVKYENPFKTLKIGSKNYASKFKNGEVNNWAESSKGTLKGKLNIVPKKNWKIQSINYFERAVGQQGRWKKIKKGAKINLTAKRGNRVSIVMKNRKTGIEHRISINR